jgi:hypothetical protein
MHSFNLVILSLLTCTVDLQVHNIIASHSLLELKDLHDLPPCRLARVGPEDHLCQTELTVEFDDTALRHEGMYCGAMRYPRLQPRGRVDKTNPLDLARKVLLPVKYPACKCRLHPRSQSTLARLIALYHCIYSQFISANRYTRKKLFC